ncbi:MAG: CpsD/CapB family tyrosine-protein kinase [Clostridia bacterium]|nr:CpsD/CapB family tyrosine-protein kinase [Clostridia bacterium]
MNNELVIFNDPRSPISEIFRTLRTNIQFMNQSKSSHALLITSTNASEGKSWITSNLALAISQTGKKVIIIDGDMRKGRLHHIFGLHQKPGLSNYLSGVYDDEKGRILTGLEDYIQHTDIQNLDIISSGNIPPNPSELLILPQMGELLADLKQSYDYIIIDGTPCGLVTDSLILSRVADSVVLVASCKETKKKDLQRVTDNIKNVGGKIVGVILNKVEMSSKKYEKTYYYGSSSRQEK